MSNSRWSPRAKHVRYWLVLGGAGLAAMALAVGFPPARGYALQAFSDGRLLVANMPVITKEMAAWAGKVLRDPASAEWLKKIAASILAQYKGGIA